MEQKFFAFISYSRKDISIARTIQRKLEKYPYPKDKVQEENRPNDSKYLRRIFLDVTDLSVREYEFTDELKERIEQSKYLIVICSKNSKGSDYVNKEIDYFYKVHGENESYILPIFIDEVISNFHLCIDEIIGKRNCPIYFSTEVKTTHRLDNKYCFYHIVEFLLKVDFNYLFNRYMAYTKYRARKRFIGLLSFFIILTLTLGYGFYTKSRLSEFEKKTFPYSLVVGYVNNFMSPLLDCMDSTSERSFVFLMPRTYDDLDNMKRGKMYFDFIKSSYSIVDSMPIVKESYRSPIRKRDLDIMRLNCQDFSKLVYLDLVNTVSAFKYVIDYKIESELYKLDRDDMVLEYTNEFIQCSLDSLDRKKEILYFVRDTFELRNVLNNLLND